MKVYLFNSESGLYAGEDFEEADMLEYVEGVTPIVPPPYRAGEVPVFDNLRKSWSIVPVTQVRERLKAVNAGIVEKNS